MWTSFIRALMGRRVGDKVTDGGGSTKELQLRDDCLQVWHNVHNLNNRSNVSLAEHKRCQQRDDAHDIVHRFARLVCPVMLRQKATNRKAEQPRAENADESDQTDAGKHGRITVKDGNTTSLKGRPASRRMSRQAGRTAG